MIGTLSIKAATVYNSVSSTQNPEPNPLIEETRQISLHFKLSLFIKTFQL